MKWWLSWIARIGAILFLGLVLFNSSMIAKPPVGSIRIIAHRAIPQLYDHQGVGRDTCTADRIEQPVHNYLENTTRSIEKAVEMGADMVEIDIAPTADGRIAVFHDWTVDCRTNGKGETRRLTLAQLQALDAGYGYTADGGKTFPFRGTGQRIPSLEEALRAVGNISILYNFKSNDPKEADLLAAALKAANRDVVARQDGFYGAESPVKRIRELYPKAWAFSMDDAKSCTKSYIAYGWTGIVPAACRNGTIFVPLDRQWAYWGWPNRLIQRIEGVGGHVVVIGPRSSEIGTGLTLPEQIGKIPSSFKGTIWAEDYWVIGPAFRPSRDFRTQTQIDATEAGLKRRREKYF